MTKSDSLGGQFVKFFASVRLTVALLLILAATSVIGTLIPQNQSQRFYFEEYGEFLYRLFSFLDFFDMYRSWWFQVILALVAVNLLVCSFQRLPSTWRVVKKKPTKFNRALFERADTKFSYRSRMSAEEAEAGIVALFGKSRLGRPVVEKTEQGFTIFSDQGRWTRLGPYIVHTGFLLILVGGLVGSIFGFSAYVNVPEGETVSAVHLRGQQETRDLPFSVRCEDFHVAFYEPGEHKVESRRPKEFRSTLTIIENGEPAFTRDIRVNSPLRYRGINIFQSSYGQTPPEEVTLALKNPKTGIVHEITAGIGETVEMPEGAGTFAVTQFQDHFVIRDMNIGPAFILHVYPAEGEPRGVLLPLRMPDFDKRRGGHFVFNVEDYAQGHYTGLQVTSDPGVWLVYAGFLFLIGGCVVTFFMPNRTTYVEAVQGKKGTEVLVAGRTTKNRITYTRQLADLARRLSDATDGDMESVPEDGTLN
ncbi:MAG: cytochrome c biogenesis protein ResB [Desulfatibacillaceae bacterium]